MLVKYLLAGVYSAVSGRRAEDTVPGLLDADREQSGLAV